MSNLQVPEPRVSSTQGVQKAFKWIKSFWFPTHINMYLLFVAETALTLANKLNGAHKNPREYLNRYDKYKYKNIFVLIRWFLAW